MDFYRSRKFENWNIETLEIFKNFEICRNLEIGRIGNLKLWKNFDNEFLSRNFLKHHKNLKIFFNLNLKNKI